MKKALLLCGMVTFSALQAQVTLVKDLCSGTCSSMPAYGKNRMVYNGKLILGAKESTSVQLWSSDGTDAGTVLLKIISANGNDSNPQGFIKMGDDGKLYFSANNGVNSNGTNNYELWETDGTLAGTYMTKEINTSSANPGSYPAGFVVYNGNLYFKARTAAVGDELYTSDGTNAGTVLIADINTGSANSTPANFTIAGGQLYFVAENSMFGREVFVTTGPTAGTISVVDFINIGAVSSSPDNLIAFNNKLYFTATNPINGVELWQTDGSVGGTTMVADLNPGTADSAPDDLFIFNGKLFFSAVSPGSGRELHFADATSSGLVKNINTAAGGGSMAAAANFIEYGNVLYFVANDGIHGAELWRTDGTDSGTSLIKDINLTGDSNMSDPIVYNGKLIFQANDGVNGAELWISDGTEAGTIMLSDINPGAASSSPKDFILYNDDLYFTATNATTGTELWKVNAAALGVHNVTSVMDSIKLYPNPSKDYFELSGDVNIQSVEIFSLQGQLVKTFGQRDQYPTADLAKGAYVVKITSDNGSSSQRLIVE